MRVSRNGTCLGLTDFSSVTTTGLTGTGRGLGLISLGLWCLFKIGRAHV